MIKYIVKCYRRDECVREETFDTYNAAKHFYDNTPGIGSKDFGDTGTYDKVAWFKLNQVELDMWTRKPKYVNPTIKDVHTEHCCEVHRVCAYGQEDTCTVCQGIAPASYPCICDW
jgi:hypothetical protein